MISRTLDRLPDARTFLEVGCGQGAVAQRLALRYEYVSYEPDAAAFAVASSRLAAVRRGRVINAPLPEVPDASFDLVGAFEVLEHMEDDAAVLRAWIRWLKPGGSVILSVPAHQHRFGAWDRVVGHFRRYGRADLVRVLSGAGFEQVTVLACGFPLGFVLESARNLLAPRDSPATAEEQTARSGRLLQPSAGVGWVTQLATAPFRWMQLPFVRSDLATAFVACARRPA